MNGCLAMAGKPLGAEANVIQQSDRDVTAVKRIRESNCFGISKEGSSILTEAESSLKDQEKTQKDFPLSKSDSLHALPMALAGHFRIIFD
ncbi:hypothetical protein P7K49_031925 [Saguinus oedipus]|uniref:Uncharacterized protein n=1 Tax=Saguinus oedipus TaxID=9490 RepID=A0ABQ9U1Y4_SAGOE|nr:hypothetical protein P7K49_031925 [Saguinus oedipus]